MPRKLISIDECLFDAWANKLPGSDPQDESQLWAIVEAARRVDPLGRRWQETNARKDHHCIRGCEIKDGDLYYRHKIYSGWGNDWKFCLSCVAMILYFQEVERLPYYSFTHWSVAEERPVRVAEEKSMFSQE